MIDIVYYGGDTGREETLQSAKIYCNISNILISKDPSEINDFVKNSTSPCLLFIGCPTRFKSGLPSQVSDNEIVSFRYYQLDENFFVPTEPLTDYRAYTSDLESFRVEGKDLGNKSEVTIVNPVYMISRRRFMDLQGLDVYLSDHFDIYLSLINREMGGKNYLYKEPVLACKLSKSKDGRSLCMIGSRFVKNYISDCLSLGIEVWNTIEATGDREYLTDRSLVELAKLYEGKSLAIVSGDLKPNAADFIMALSIGIPCHYYLDYENRRLESFVGFWESIDKYRTSDLIKLIDLVMAPTSSEGFIFRHPFTNYNCREAMAVQLAGFMGFSEVTIYEGQSIDDDNYLNLINILGKNNIKIQRIVKC